MTAPVPGAAVPDSGSRPTVDKGKAAGSVLDTVKDAVTSGVSAVNPLSGLDEAANATREWMADRHNWARVAWFSGGVILFIVGAAMVAGRSAGVSATSVVPVGKAVKLAGKALK